MSLNTKMRYQKSLFIRTYRPSVLHFTFYILPSLSILFRFFFRSNQLQHIAQHAHSSNRRTRTSTLDDQRSRAIPLRMEHDNIIGPTERGREGVGGWVPS